MSRETGVEVEWLGPVGKRRPLGYRIREYSLDRWRWGRKYLRMKLFLSYPLFLFVLLTSAFGEPSSVMIRLVDPLDEPEFYCVDVPGYGKNVQLEAPVMAHTLKHFGSADEMWTMDYPSEGQI